MKVYVLFEYTQSDRERIREKLIERRDELGVGMPTLSKSMYKLVSAFRNSIVLPGGGTGLNPENVTEKDLNNLISGVKTTWPKLQVIDAYLQIVALQSKPPGAVAA